MAAGCEAIRRWEERKKEDVRYERKDREFYRESDKLLRDLSAVQEVVYDMIHTKKGCR